MLRGVDYRKSDPHEKYTIIESSRETNIFVVVNRSSISYNSDYTHTLRYALCYFIIHLVVCGYLRYLETLDCTFLQDAIQGFHI